MTLITDLQKELTCTLITPDDPSYQTERKTYMRVGSPAVIVIPKTSEDIRAVIAYAKANGIVLSVRSGGHGGLGQSTNDGGIVLDMRQFAGVELLDQEKGHVRIGSGAKWGEVAAALAPHNLVISAGDTASVGVGGLTVGGGIGIMARKYGLAIDQLIGAEVITADGEVLYASSSENPNLFWALRGGTGNVGVVTHFDFAAHQLSHVSFGTVAYGIDDLKKLLTGWRDAMRNASDDLTTTLVVMPGFGGNPPSAQLLFCFANDSEAAGKEALEPFLSIAPVHQQKVELIHYSEALQEAHPPAGMVALVKDSLINSLDNTVIDTLVQQYTNPEGRMMFLRSLGGAINNVDSSDTAYAHRSHEALLVCAAFLPEDAPQEARQSALRFFDESIAPLSTDAYPNFFTLYSEEDLERMYPQKTLDRLRTIKTTYDKTNLFSQNYNILPL